MNLNHFYHYYKSKSGGGVSNLLKASEEFQQTVDWVRYPTSSQTPTVNADSRPDPNGGTTADQVGFTANTSARLQQTLTLEASTEYTFSVHARAVSGTVDFRMRNVTLKDSEVKTATTTGPDGGGFTRFTYTFTTGAAGSYELALQNDTNATAKDVIFWGAMLNQGGTALDYEYAAPTTGGSAPAPAYAGFGDAFGGVTAYYSLRQFTEAETLNAIRVRRSSDDTEQDIGFDANGDLDTTALLAFVGTGGTDNGFVTTWYDQSGNGNNATNATESEQPLIVDGGTLVEENGKAAIDFDYNSSNNLSASPTDWSFVTSSNTSIFMVMNLNQYSTPRSVLYNISGDEVSSGHGDTLVSMARSNQLRIGFYDKSAGSWTPTPDGFGIGIDGFAAQQNLISSIYNSSGALDSYANNTISGSITSNPEGSITANKFFIGSNSSGTNPMDGNLQEFIIFNSDETSNRTGIETNINDHFSIYP